MDIENALEAAKNYLLKNVFEPKGIGKEFFDHPGMRYYLFVIADEMVRSVLEEGGNTFDLLKTKRAKEYARAVINETKERFVFNLAEAMAGYGMRNDQLKNQMAERRAAEFLDAARSIVEELTKPDEKEDIEPKNGMNLDAPNANP